MSEEEQKHNYGLKNVTGMNWYVSKTLWVRQFEWLEYMAFHHVAIAFYGFLPHMKGVLGVTVGSLNGEVLGVLVGAASACIFESALVVVSSAFDATVCSLGVFLGRCCFGICKQKA